MNLSYRPYVPSDREDCIRLFRTNIPRYFRNHESEEFAEFLDSLAEKYFMVSADKEVVGCGGYYFQNKNSSARFCWGMVDKQKHGNRIGEYLLLARLHEINSATNATTVTLGTCQLTQLFFARYGFIANSIKTDGIAKGLDEIEMSLDLSESTRKKIELKWQAISG